MVCWFQQLDDPGEGRIFLLQTNLFGVQMSLNGAETRAG